MGITKRTHYNPCFWTALWNKTYYTKVLDNENASLKVRKQKVYSLNIFMNEVRHIRTSETFFEKKLGLIDFDSNDIRKFVERNYPENAEERNIPIKDEELRLDFENIFTTLEKSPAYTNLISIARDKQINSLEEKGNIATLLIIHSIRNHVTINSIIEFGKPIGHTKLEYFIHLKWMLHDSEYLKSIVLKYVTGDWIFYISKKPFPLIDSPVTNNNGLVLCTLNPYLILTIDLTNSSGKIKYTSSVPSGLRKKIRRRLISNTYREIVFNTEKQALMWKNSKEWDKRRKLILNKSTYSGLIHKIGNEELWQINKYANKL